MDAIREECPAGQLASRDGLSVRLFGPMEARVGGELMAPLRTRKDAWLLALLLLRCDREVERTWLCGVLWPESARVDASYNLRRSLAELRRALGSAGGHLLSPTPHTLRLAAGDADVDLLEFDAAIRRGDVGALKAAISLYKGPLLEGCLEEWVLPEREARLQAYLDALKTLAAHALAHGNLESAVAYLRREVAVDPLSESAHRRLMQALASAGECAAAKSVYRHLRQVLRRELNAEPDPETGALWERIQDLQRRRALSPRSPVQPGYLPQPLSSLVGREVEMKEVAARIGVARLLTLTGPGGAGKTRLAIRAAEERIPCHAGGVWFVDLSPLDDPALLPHVVATALRLGDHPTLSRVETLVHELQGRAVLLVLDNCEHLVDGCARLAHALLRGCREVRVLATSREPLGVAGEVIMPVPPLAAPSQDSEMDSDPAMVLAEYDAVRLFVERASIARPGWQTDSANIGHAARICQQLDGNPLAIELAAARLRILSVEQIAARLDERFHLLTGGNRTALPRHQTLRATMDWSYDLLSVPERLLLCRLSVFAGSCTLEAAEEVCAGVPLKATDILSLLGVLADKSLLDVKDDGGAARYRLLETVRQYARDRLVESGREALDGVRGRHRDFFLKITEAGAPRLYGVEQVEWLDSMAAELDNLRAVLAWSLDSDTDMGLRLVIALNSFWATRDRLSEARHWVTALLQKASSGCPHAYAMALWHAGVWTKIQGDKVAARLLFERGLAIGREVGDSESIAAALYQIGLLDCERGDYRQALPVFEESARLHQEFGDATTSLCSRIRIGIVYCHVGEEAKGLGILEECLDLARMAEDRVAMVMALDHLGDFAADRGDYPSARGFHEEKLALVRSLSDHRQVAQTLNDLGRVSWRDGDLAAARLLQEEALAVARRYCGAAQQSPCLNYMAHLALAEGDLERMEALSRESLQISADAQLMTGVADALRQLAAVAVGRGAADRGARLLGAAGRLQEPAGPVTSFGAQDLLDRTMAAARTMLGDSRLDSALSHGRTLPLEQAIACALDP